MVSFTKIEQDEIINTFLETIEANDILKEMKTRCSKCNCNYDHASIALKQSILPENVIEQIKSFKVENTEYCRKCGDFILETDIENLEYENRRINTLDIFFLLYDFPNDKEIHKIFNYNKNLSTTLFGLINSIKRGCSRSTKNFNEFCDKWSRDTTITLRTINKIFRHVFDDDKYKRFDFEYPFSTCPVFKLS